MGERARESGWIPERCGPTHRLLFTLTAALCFIMLLLVDAPRPAAAAEEGQVGGVVSYVDGSPAVGVAIDLFTAQPGGGRDRFLQSTTTDAAGRYGLEVDDGCYVIVLIAPDNQQFRQTGSYHQASVCTVDGVADRSVDGLLRNAAATVSGRADFSVGGSVPQVVVDLFNSDDGRRAGYITSTATGDDGTFTLSLPSDGCYQLVFIAPVGNTFISGSPYSQHEVCVDDGDQVNGVDAVVTSANSAQIGGRVTHEDGSGAEQTTIDLFRAAGDGTRGAYLRSTASDIGGLYRFDLAPGCYVVVMIAPAGETFIGTGPFHQLEVCVAADDVATSLDGLLAGNGEPPTGLNAVELEISRLTNELRANPSGPLGRRKPMPDCVDEGFYAISVNPVSGHPESVPVLELSELVSIEMARAWAVDMQQRDRFEHRPSSSQQQIFGRLGISATAWGENIAWFSGYPPEETARIHFEGWRESDTGHYCSLITPRFTTFGVGEHRMGDQSWAVQNFYASSR